MAGNAPELRIVGSINREATRKAIQADLDKISKSLTLKIGVGQDGKTDLGKSMKNQAESVKKSYKTMESANAEFGIKFAKSLEKREAQQRKLSVSQDKYINKVKIDTEKEIALKEKLIAKINELQTQSQRNASALGKYKLNTEERSALTGYTTDMKNLGDATGKSTKELQSMVTKAQTATRGIRDLGTEVKASGRSALRFGEYLTNAFKGFTMWSIVTVGWYSTINAIKNGIKSVADLDMAMTELNKVTDLTNSEMTSLLDNASKVGKELMATTSSVVQATAAFARMGFAANQSLELAGQALLLKNVGDGIDSVEASTSTLISTIKGFSLEAEDAAHIVDTLNSVSNNFAVTTSDLAEGIKRAASVSGAAGATFEQTIGMLTAMTEVSQNAQSSSNALKTLALRIQGLEEDGTSLGESFTAKLNDALEKTAGVSITTGGKLRNLYDIVVELGGVWKGLTQEQQIYLAQELAGIRQSGQLIGMLNNYQSVVNATTTALNSQGSALEEAEKYYDSIDGKVNQLKSSMERLWTTTISSDSVKDLLELTNSFVGLIDTVGLFNVVIIALTTAFIKFGGVQSAQVVLMYAVDLAMKKTTISAIATTGAMGALGAVMNALPLIAVVTGITLITSALVKSIKSTREYNKALEENKDKLSDMFQAGQLDEMKATVDVLKEAKKSVDAYNNAMKLGGNYGMGGIDKDVVKEYENAKNTLALYGVEVSEVSDKVLELEGNVKKLIKSTEDDSVARYKLTTILSQTDTVLRRVTSSMETLKKTQEDTSEIVDKLNDGYQYQGFELIELLNTYPQLNKYLDDSNNLTITKEELLRELIGTQKEMTIESLKNDAKELESKKELLNGTITYYEKYLEIAEAMIRLDAQAQGRDVSLITEKSINDASGALVSAKKGLTAVNKSIIETRRNIGILSTNFDGGNSKTTTPSSSSPSSDKKDILSNFSAQQKAVADLAYEMDILGKKTELAEGDERIRLQENTIEMYKKQKEAVHQYSNAIRGLISKGGLSKEDLEKLNNQLQDNGKEWGGIEVAIKSLSDTIASDYQKAMEDALKIQEELAKDVTDVFKEITDALEKQDERRTEEAKNQIKNRISDVEYELDELERAYRKASDNLEEADINEKISALIKERLMRSVEGSLDANARIYEIDKELVDLNKDLSEQKRKVEYENKKQSLEDEKDKLAKEIDAEEEALKERQRNNVYFAQARVLIEANAMAEIIALLGTYNEAYALDGAMKGDAWAKAFTERVLAANKFLQGSSSGSTTPVSSNQQSYLTNMVNTGTVGQKVWANQELAKAGVSSGKSNQQLYLENLVATGSAGNKAWAQNELNLKRYHTGIENGLVGGESIPKKFEELAILAKGEGVFTHDQMSNLSGALNSIIPRQSSNTSSIRIDNLIGNLNANLSSNQDIIATSKMLAKATVTELQKNGIRLS